MSDAAPAEVLAETTAPEVTPATEISEATDVPTSTEVSEACTSDSKRCSTDRRSRETCTAGTWTAFEACGADKVCVDVHGPYCIPASGDASCYEQLRCATDCATGDANTKQEDCVVQCIAGTKKAEQDALIAAAECFQHQCGTVCQDQGITQPALCYKAIFDCVADRCATTLATCDFAAPATGDKRCSDIDGCAANCNVGSDHDRAQCTIECGAEADADARKLYAVLDLCDYYVCTQIAFGCQLARDTYCGSYAKTCHDDQP